MKYLILFGMLILTLSCSSVDPDGIVVNSADLSGNKIYAFVGKKVSVEKFEPEPDEYLVLMDLAYMATYEVIEQYSGLPLGEVVQFEAYDHYGFPNFAKHDTALIYLQEENGKLYHVKYRYDYVRFSDKYGWVTCGTSLNWEQNEVLRPLYIFAGKKCQKGNLASNIAKARILTGDVD